MYIYIYIYILYGLYIYIIYMAYFNRSLIQITLKDIITISFCHVWMQIFMKYSSF